MLNRLWLSFFLMGFIACLWQSFNGNIAVFNDVMNSVFSMSKVAVDIAIGLIGLMCFWLGLFKVIEEAGLIHYLSKALAPLFAVIMPEVPKDHPAQSAITMNLAANMLGLDNAATPIGIKAMQSLQSLNPLKDTASNAQILFLVLNTSSVTLLPVTIFMYRAQAGAASSTDVFLPILLATSVSSFVGLIAVAAIQRLPIYKPVVIAYFTGFALFISTLSMIIQSVSQQALREYSSLSANIILFSFILLTLSYAAVKKINVYEQFIIGAKEGFKTAIDLIPYLLAMLVAIGVLRSSGILDLLTSFLGSMLGYWGVSKDIAEALPTAFMKPLSGSGSRAMMLESFNQFGVDSLVARITSVMQGSTETTFYVIAVYFGAVGIKFGRHAIFCGLLADAAGLSAAVVISCLFFT